MKYQWVDCALLAGIAAILVNCVSPSIFLAILLYWCLVRIVRQWRYHFINSMAMKGIKEKNRDLIYFVHYILTANDLNFECHLSMAVIGLLSTYSIPSISTLLKSTGGFSHDIQRRYADMEILIREFNENPPNGIKRESIETFNWLWNNSYPRNKYKNNSTISIEEMYKDYNERARKAIFRLNAIHNKYSSRILYRDMLYVLSIFTTTGAAYCSNNSFCVIRSMSPFEREACFHHWMEIGRLMNLDVDSEWKSFDECLQWRRAYEKKYRKFFESNKIIAHSTIEYFIDFIIQYIPSKIIVNFVRSLLLMILGYFQEDNDARIALGLHPTVPLIMSITITCCLYFRCFVIRNFMFPLPLSWTARLTNIAGIPLDDAAQSHCPMKQYKYYLNNWLDYGNTTYTPYLGHHKVSKAYIIENLGPEVINKGDTCMEPVYAERKKKEQKQNEPNI